MTVHDVDGTQIIVGKLQDGKYWAVFNNNRVNQFVVANTEIEAVGMCFIEIAKMQDNDFSKRFYPVTHLSLDNVPEQYRHFMCSETMYEFAEQVADGINWNEGLAVAIDCAVELINKAINNEESEIEE